MSYGIAKFLTDEQKAAICEHFYTERMATRDEAGFCPMGFGLWGPQPEVERAYRVRAPGWKQVADFICEYQQLPPAQFHERVKRLARAFIVDWDRCTIKDLRVALDYNPSKEA